jgi:hypothetical protein
VLTRTIFGCAAAEGRRGGEHTPAASVTAMNSARLRAVVRPARW